MSLRVQRWEWSWLNVSMSNQHIILSKKTYFFYGKYWHVNEFITLTASIYHPLLKTHVILATMDCKQEDTNYVERFWRIFNNAYEEVNLTKKKFNPTGWCSDMSGANFNLIKKIYGEDVLNQIKSCKFHYKE